MIETRELTTIAEYEEAVALQKEIWGFADIELLPRRLFVVAHKVGGQTLGAFDGNRMVAFLIAIPGLKFDGSIYLHSHMLGTHRDYRDQGLGRKLKLMQRDEALSRGIKVIEWTFDPLETKNAYFNLQRLGATIRRFVPNQYGMTSSHLHGGLPTDRCIAEWRLDSPRVRAAVEGNPLPESKIERRIDMPSNIEELRQTDLAAARIVQTAVRERFLADLREGFEAVGFENLPGTASYLLAARED
ncbi:MAG TPA: GNAT family N-acetyltransferase [Bryobacteraceae bacterium]|nr:GNAT family N-acetyltransferase [Bryobacteraceae bacterium]